MASSFFGKPPLTLTTLAQCHYGQINHQRRLDVKTPRQRSRRLGISLRLPTRQLRHHDFVMEYDRGISLIDVTEIPRGLDCYPPRP